jgi:hypothetical protein
MKKILILGGGEFHDYAECSRILAEHLKELRDKYESEIIINDLSYLHRQVINNYDLVVLYYTKDRLKLEEKRGLVEWCADGGKVVGIHCTTTAFRNSPEFGAMMGGVFRKHPPHRAYTVSLNMEHPAMQYIDEQLLAGVDGTPYIHEYTVVDEQFLNDYDSRVNISATAPFKGRIWPVAWSKAWGKGKVYYLALGHDPAACKTDFFKAMFLAGIKWVDSLQEEPCNFNLE